MKDSRLSDFTKSYSSILAREQNNKKIPTNICQNFIFIFFVKLETKYFISQFFKVAMFDSYILSSTFRYKS